MDFPGLTWETDGSTLTSPEYVVASREAPYGGVRWRFAAILLRDSLVDLSYFSTEILSTHLSQYLRESEMEDLMTGRHLKTSFDLSGRDWDSRVFVDNGNPGVVDLRTAATMTVLLAALNKLGNIAGIALGALIHVQWRTRVMLKLDAISDKLDEPFEYLSDLDDETAIRQGLFKLSEGIAFDSNGPVNQAKDIFRPKGAVRTD